MKTKIGKIAMIMMILVRMIICAAPVSANQEIQETITSLNVPVRFQYDIDTEGLEEGNAVPLETTQDIYLNGEKIFNQGGAGFAYIDELKRARFFGRGGKIRITRGQLVDIHGKSHEIYLSANSKGNYKFSSPAGVIMGASSAYSLAESGLQSGTAVGSIFGIGSILIPVAFFFQKGKEAKLARGKIIFARPAN